MTDDAHVYCANCQNFRTDDKDKPYCPFEDECDIWNCEDSRPFKERPRYEPKINRGWTCRFCGFLNLTRYEVCERCGAARK